MIRRLALTLILVASAAHSQPLDLDAIAKQPGTQVTKRVEKGAEVVEIKRGGVTVTIEGDKELSVDSSGKAVLCYWNMAVVLKIAADLCYPDEFPQLRKMLGEEIDAANDLKAFNDAQTQVKDLQTELMTNTQDLLTATHDAVTEQQGAAKLAISQANAQLSQDKDTAALYAGQIAGQFLASGITEGSPAFEAQIATQAKTMGIDPGILATAVTAELQAQLMSLELAGHLARLPGGLFQRIELG